MTRKNSRRLFKGAPHVSQSVTPAKRNVPRRKPPTITKILFTLRNFQRVQAQSGISTTPSLHRTENAAPVRIPASSAGPIRPVGESARKKAASSIAVEIGRG